MTLGHNPRFFQELSKDCYRERLHDRRHMMRAYAAVLSTAVAFLQSTNPAQACGDKFLLVGRGVEFHRAYAALYPASIVIYAKPPGDAAKAIRDPRLQANLKQSGHRVVLVESDAALARALEDRVDLILTDIADAERLSRQASAAPSKPTVLPVMYRPTDAEARSVEARYQCRLTSADRADRYLAAIDNAMKTRADDKKKKSRS